MRKPNHPKSDISQQRVMELFVYDPQTGVFTRRINRRAGRAGAVAGCRSVDGYWQISIDGSAYKAHRLAWLYVYGKWPDHQIDHIDGNKLNNSIANLRDVPQSTNMLNISKPGSSNSTGYRGVRLDRKSGSFAFDVKVGGRCATRVGFGNAAAAHQGYLLMKEIMINEAKQ